MAAVVGRLLFLKNFALLRRMVVWLRRDGLLLKEVARRRRARCERQAFEADPFEWRRRHAPGVLDDRRGSRLTRTVSTQAPEDKRTVYTQTHVSFVRDRCFISDPLVDTFTHL